MLTLKRQIQLLLGASLVDGIGHLPGSSARALAPAK